MLSTPTFERVAIVGDSPTLMAEAASLFARPGRYLPIVDGPRIGRSDASNEVIRRSNALAFAGVERRLLAGLADDQTEERDDWLDELYALGEGGDASARFSALCARARSRLPGFPFEQYKRLLFVTSGFPWGIAVPECATTHMYDYPDFGRSVVEGLW